MFYIKSAKTKNNVTFKDKMNKSIYQKSVHLLTKTDSCFMFFSFNNSWDFHDLQYYTLILMYIISGESAKVSVKELLCHLKVFNKYFQETHIIIFVISFSEAFML